VEHRLQNGLQAPTGHPLGNAICDSWNDLKSFEFRVAERKRLTLASLLMGGPELFGLGPGREIILCRPYGMR
jgi:hypothetical protein